MKVKFVGLEPTTRGNSNGMLFKGTKDYDGSAYEKFYFDTTQQGDETPLHAVAKTLKPGDLVELKYDASKFKNLESITKLDASQAGTSKSSGRGGSRASSGKGDRVPFRHPDNTDRSSSMYLAKELVFGLEGIDGSKKVPAKQQNAIMAQFQDLAKTLTAFIQTGDFVVSNGTPAPDVPAGGREPGSDDGNPDDDDDIPF